MSLRARTTPLFPKEDSPWTDPEKRKSLVKEAIEVRDLGLLLEGYEVYLALRGIGPAKSVYQHHLKGLFTFVWGTLGRKGLDWDAGDVRRYFDYQAKRGSAYTLQLTAAATRRFAEFLEWAGLAWPEHLEIPTIFATKKTRPLTPEELRLFFRRLEDYPSSWQRVLEALAIVVTQTGMNGLQALKLQVHQIDLASRHIELVGSRIPMSRDAVRRLANYLTWRGAVLHKRPGHPLLFVDPRGHPVDYTLFRNHLRKFIQWAELDLPGGHLRSLRATGVQRLVQTLGSVEAKRVLRQIDSFWKP